MKYIWQKDNWYNFTWSAERLLDLLGAGRKKQGIILGKGDLLNLKNISYILSEEAMNTSEIEGEKQMDLFKF